MGNDPMSDSVPEPAAQPQPAPVPALRRSRRRWVRYFALAMFISFFCYAAWTVVSRQWIRWQSERELAATRAELDQRPPVGQNSAELIPKIKKLAHADWGKELAKREWQPLLELPLNVRYSPAVLAEVRRDLTASAAAVNLARTLKDYPRGNRAIVLKPDVLSTLLQDTQDTRMVADLLRWDIVSAVEMRDNQRALDDLLALLNASRSIGDEPFMISQLVRMAVRTVAIRAAERVLAHMANAPALIDFQAALARDAEEPLLLYGVRGDRAAFDRLFENLDTGVATARGTFDADFDDPLERLGWWQYRAWLPGDHAYAMHWLTQCVESAITHLRTACGLCRNSTAAPGAATAIHPGWNASSRCGEVCTIILANHGAGSLRGGRDRVRTLPAATEAVAQVPQRTGAGLSPRRSP